MLPSLFSQLLKVFTLFAVIAAPLAAQAGDPPTVEDFNNHVFKISNKAVRTQLDVAGENNAMRCDDMMVTVNNAVFRCIREKGKCEERTAPNGTPVAFCLAETNECDQQAFLAAQDFWAANGTCKEMKVNVSSPGCGNMITEFGEDCDLGEANGTPTAACSDTCTPKAAVAQGGLCGNQVVDAGEECDSGPDNGKTDCDQQCRKFSTAGNAPVAVQAQPGNPVAAQAQPGNSATAGCALHSFGNNDFSLWHLLALGMGTGWLLFRVSPTP